MSKDHLHSSIRDLIRTEKRMKIFEIVSSQEDSFTCKEIYNRLQEKKVDVRITTVLVFLRGLCYRKYLKETKEDRSASKIRRRGRSTIRYMVI